MYEFVTRKLSAETKPEKKVRTVITLDDKTEDTDQSVDPVAALEHEKKVRAWLTKAYYDHPLLKTSPLAQAVLAAQIKREGEQLAAEQRAIYASSSVPPEPPSSPAPIFTAGSGGRAA
jgi:hypothetical protein